MNDLQLLKAKYKMLIKLDKSKAMRIKHKLDQVKKLYDSRGYVTDVTKQ